jgi:phosphohistidine phosphatase
MHLYLLRHADADTPAEIDEQRFLSEKGMMQSNRVARFCDAHNIHPQHILSSPLRRAHQTAAAVAALLKSELVTVRWLACGATPEAILERLDEYKTSASVMLVGHEPDIGILVARLIGSRPLDSIHIRKASLTLVDIPDLTLGIGRIEFSIPVKLM